MRTEDSAAIEARIINLRRDRLAWRDIGAQVGLSHERCRQIFNAAIDRYPAANLAALSAEEDELCDESIHRLRELIADPEITHRNIIEAFKTLLMWSEAKRKIHGIDAPLRREVEMIDTTSMDARLLAEIQQMEAEFRASEQGSTT